MTLETRGIQTKQGPTRGGSLLGTCHRWVALGTCLIGWEGLWDPKGVSDTPWEGTSYRVMNTELAGSYMSR